MSTPTVPEKQDLSSSDNHHHHPETDTITPRFPLPMFSWEDVPPMPQQLTQLFTPGNILFVSSVPFSYRAYRDYRTFSQHIQARAVVASSSSSSHAVVPDNKLGMMVASKALGIATRGSVGLFALTGSLIFFGNGWSSLSDAVDATQKWAQSRRQRLITIFGLKDHNNDPDLVETKQMTDEQALDYLAKKYYVSQEEDERGRKEELKRES